MDIRGMLPDGTRYRERIRPPVTTYTAAMRWGQQREAAILLAGGSAKKQECEPAPTLGEFWPVFIEGHAKANREKSSSLRARESIYRTHLAPRWADKPLDAITAEEVQKLKGSLSGLAAKTVNNVLVCLSVVLKTAVEWNRLATLPCRIRLVKVDKGKKPEFYEDEQLDRLVEAATFFGIREQVVVLLGADAGLRRGEVLGLEWTDLDTKRGEIVVQRAVYRGVEGTPKSGESRTVPMTDRLRAALAAHRHLQGPRVIVGATDEGIRALMEKIERKAGLPSHRTTKRGRPRYLGRFHKLRHTFGTRLAMAGVAPRTIMELMGHANIETSMRYMHVVKAAPAAAIRALDLGTRRAPAPGAETIAKDGG